MLIKITKSPGCNPAKGAKLNSYRVRIFPGHDYSKAVEQKCTEIGGKIEKWQTNHCIIVNESCGNVMGWFFPQSNPYTESLTPSSSECNCM